MFQHNAAGKMVIKNFYARNIGKLSRSCGTCYESPDVRRSFEVKNVVVDILKEAIVALQMNKNDSSVLENIQVTNAKRNKNGTFFASICKLYRYNPDRRYSFYASSGPLENVCTWGKDVTIS